MVGVGLGLGPSLFEMLIGLVVILVACELFVNGIEWLGKHYALSTGATGSILAGVGTALPETMVPIIAIFFAREGGCEIGVGAILGAPFMLVSLAMFVGGITVLIGTWKGRRNKKLLIDVAHTSHDLAYFILAYSSVLIASVFPHILKEIIAILLIFSYLLYAQKVLKSEGVIDTTDTAPLYLKRTFFSVPNKINPELIQTIIGLILIWVGAKIFVDSLATVSHYIGIPLFVLAFLLSPIATELPEKFNSMIWYWRGKDTLALGNITGAMVFQATFPISVGLLFTPWIMGTYEVLGMVLALTGAITYYLYIKIKGEMNAYLMLGGGVLYGLYLVALIILTSSLH